MDFRSVHEPSCDELTLSPSLLEFGLWSMPKNQTKIINFYILEFDFFPYAMDVSTFACVRSSARIVQHRNIARVRNPRREQVIPFLFYSMDGSKH